MRERRRFDPNNKTSSNTRRVCVCLATLFAIRVSWQIYIRIHPPKTDTVAACVRMMDIKMSYNIAARGQSARVTQTAPSVPVARASDVFMFPAENEDLPPDRAYKLCAPRVYQYLNGRGDKNNRYAKGVLFFGCCETGCAVSGPFSLSDSGRDARRKNRTVGTNCVPDGACSLLRFHQKSALILAVRYVEK